MPPPKTPRSPVRQALHSLQLGFALGVAVLLVGIPLSGRLTTVLLTAAGQSAAAVFFGTMVIRELTVLFVAPTFAYGGGLFVDGSRWAVAAAMMCVIQGFALAVALIPAGLADVGPGPFIWTFVETAIGLAACGITFGRANLQARRRAGQSGSAAQAKPSVLAIDFEAIKRAEVEGAQAVPPGEAAAPAGPETPKAGSGST